MVEETILGFCIFLCLWWLNKMLTKDKIKMNWEKYNNKQKEALAKVEPLILDKINKLEKKGLSKEQIQNEIMTNYI